MPQLAAAPGAAARRRGFTLPELIVAMAIFALVSASLVALLNRQQKFYRSANEIIDTRSQLRQAAGLLPLDLRGISTVGRDLIQFDATSIRLLGNYGSGIVCQRGTLLEATHTVYLPPLNGERNTYTTWYMTPKAADSVFLYDEGNDRGAVDDRWVRFAIDAIDSVKTSALFPVCAPTASPSFTAATENDQYRYRVRVKLPGTTGDAVPLPVAAIPDSVKVGAAVRFERPVEYSLYQPSGTSLWYLGFRESRGGAWSTVQPIGGPYREPGTAAGVGFRYYNDVGGEVVAGGDARTIARVDMVVRAAGTDRTNVISRKADGVFEDSLRVRVAIRNRQ